MNNLVEAEEYSDFEVIELLKAIYGAELPPGAKTKWDEMAWNEMMWSICKEAGNHHDSLYPSVRQNPMIGYRTAASDLFLNADKIINNYWQNYKDDWRYGGVMLACHRLLKEFI